MAVFVLELSLAKGHFGGSTKEMKPRIRKAMNYLWCMTAGSLSAYKAWRIFRRLLVALEERHAGFEMADLPREAYVPVGWTAEDEKAMAKAVSTIAFEDADMDAWVQ
jgi:hypothetical protein